MPKILLVAFVYFVAAKAQTFQMDRLTSMPEQCTLRVSNTAEGACYAQVCSSTARITISDSLNFTTGVTIPMLQNDFKFLPSTSCLF